MVTPNQTVYVPGEIDSLTGRPVVRAERVRTAPDGETLDRALTELRQDIPENFIASLPALPDAVSDGQVVIVGDQPWRGHAISSQEVTVTPADDPAGGSDDRGYVRDSFGSIDHESQHPWLDEFRFDDDDQTLVLRLESVSDPGATLEVTEATPITYTLRKTAGRGSGINTAYTLGHPNRYQYEIGVQTNPLTLSAETFTFRPASPITYWQALEFAAATDSNVGGVAFTAANQRKLAGIEPLATADQTADEIKTAYESNPNTNAFTDPERRRLASVEDNATADQTPEEIKRAYESNNDTNALTDEAARKVNALPGESPNFANKYLGWDTAGRYADLDAPTVGDSGGLTAVSTDATLTGAGTPDDPLVIANPFTATDEANLDAALTKLAGIRDGAEPNVNADWNATSGDAEILNKPTIPDAVTTLAGTAITLNARGFDTNLDSTITNVQLLAQAVDDLATGSGGAMLTPAQRATLTKAAEVLNGFTANGWVTVANAVDQGAFFTGVPILSDLDSRSFGNAYSYIGDETNVYKGFRVPAARKGDIPGFRAQVGDAVISGSNLVELGDDAGFTYFYARIASYTANDSIELQEYDLIELVSSTVDLGQWADLLEPHIQYGNIAGTPSAPANPLVGYGLVSDRDAASPTPAAGTVAVVYGDTDANNGLYYRTNTAWTTIATVKDIAAVNAAITARISSTPPGNTPGTASAGDSTDLARADHDHGITPGTGGGGGLTEVASDGTLTGKGTATDRLSVAKPVTPNLEILDHSVDSGGLRPWPNNNTQIAGPIRTAPYTALPSTPAWGNTATHDSATALAPANLVRRWLKTEYSAQPTAATEDAVYSTGYGESRVEHTPVYTTIAGDATYWYANIQFTSIPADDPTVTLLLDEPPTTSVLPRDGSITQAKVAGLTGGVPVGNVITGAADGAFGHAAPGGASETLLRYQRGYVSGGVRDWPDDNIQVADLINRAPISPGGVDPFPTLSQAQSATYGKVINRPTGVSGVLVIRVVYRFTKSVYPAPAVAPGSGLGDIELPDALNMSAFRPWDTVLDNDFPSLPGRYLQRYTTAGTFGEYLGQDNDYWYIWRYADNLIPPSENRITFSIVEPLIARQLPQDGALKQVKLDGLPDDVPAGDAITAAADGAFGHHTPSARREVYNGTQGITVAAANRRSALSPTAFDSALNRNTAGDVGLVFVTMNRRFSARSATTISYGTTAGVTTARASGFVSLATLATAPVYNGTTAIGVPVASLPVYNVVGGTATLLGHEVTYIAADATSLDYEVVTVYEPSAAHALSTLTWSSSDATRIDFDDFGASIPGGGAGGQTRVYATALPAAAGIPDNTVGIVINPASLSVKQTTVTQGTQDTGWAGKTVDPHDLATAHVGPYTVRYAASAGFSFSRNSHTATLAAGGASAVSGGLPTGSRLVWSYETANNGSSLLEVDYTSDKSATGPIVFSVGRDIVYTYRLARANARAWDGGVLGVSDYQRLLSGVWRATEPDGTGHVSTEAWTAVNLGGSGGGPTINRMALPTAVSINFASGAWSWTGFNDLFTYTATKAGAMQLNYNVHAVTNQGSDGGGRTYAEYRLIRTRGAVETEIGRQDEYIRNVNAATDQGKYASFAFWDDVQVGDVLKLQARIATQRAGMQATTMTWATSDNYQNIVAW